MADDSVREFLSEVFRDLPGIAIKRMFGGHGIYRDGRMFALEADGVVYLKTDNVNRPDFEARGLGPFMYPGRNGKVTVMSYHECPPEALESPPELAPWAKAACDAAKRAAEAKPAGNPARRRRAARDN